MTLLQALPKTDDGYILLPVAAIFGDTEIEGYSTEEFVRAAFAQFYELPVPLSDADYELLLAASTPMWQRNWERWRTEGRI